MSLLSVARAIETSLGVPRSRRAEMILAQMQTIAKREHLPKVDPTLLLIGMLAGAASVRKGAARARQYAQMTREGAEDLTFENFIRATLRDPEFVETRIDRLELSLDNFAAWVYRIGDPEQPLSVFRAPRTDTDALRYDLRAIISGDGLAEIARFLVAREGDHA
jgi:hypothetical protein